MVVQQKFEIETQFCKKVLAVCPDSCDVAALPEWNARVECPARLAGSFPRLLRCAVKW